MRNVTSKIRAAIGVLGVLVFASPLAAQNPHRRGEMRVAAQWVGRRGAIRQQMRWRRAVGWPMAGFGWQRGYAAGYGWRAYPVRGPMMRPVVVARYAAPFYGGRRRPWRRAWAGWRYRRR